MKILVTGSAGFIGSHLVDALTGLGHEVYGIDDLSGGYMRNVNPKSKFTKLDLRNREETEVYIKRVQPQIIFHLAADATEGRSQFTPINCTQRNYMAYLNLLVPAIKNGLEKIILTSSMSVYGSQKPPFSEEMERMPDDIYGVSKTAMERTTEILSQVHKFSYTIIRPHNVYGPRQNLADPYRNVIGIFINCLLKKKNFYIYGDGKQKRAFTYIDDFTPYIVKAAFQKNCNAEIINLGPSKEYSINELAKTILKIFFINSNIPSGFKPKHIPSRPQEVKDAWCTMDKAQKLLNYKPKVILEDGIECMLRWAKTLGPQKFNYLDDLEITSQETPMTWVKKLI